MTSSSLYQNIAELLLTEAPADKITHILKEAAWTEETKHDQMFYLLMFEQYLDECSVYAYDGWDDVEVIDAPVIEKYHVTVKLKFNTKLDKRSLIRLVGIENENDFSEIKEDGETYYLFRVLRSMLEDMEEDNRKRANKEAVEYGYKPSPQQEEQPEEDRGGMF